MTATSRLRQAASACLQSSTVFLKDVGNGLLEVSHNTLALVGLGVVAAALFTASHQELRADVEKAALDWLLERQESRDDVAEAEAPTLPPEPDAVARATAADPSELTRQQALVANWLARRYRVAPEPISRLVQEAWQVGQRVGLDPTLILAVMAIESSFNPFAQSPVGAQGLMQVMTRIHDDKYEAFGGVRAAFDPVTNLRVGVLVLKECIARAGSLELGLKHYVGAANLGEDGGYANKVLAEQAHLRQVTEGKPVAVTAALPPAMPATSTTPTAAASAPLPAPAPSPAAAPAGDNGEQVALLH